MIPLVAFRGMNMATHGSVLVGFWMSLQSEASSGHQVGPTEDQKMATAIKTYVFLGIGQVLGPMALGVLLD